MDIDPPPDKGDVGSRSDPSTLGSLINLGGSDLLKGIHDGMTGDLVSDYRIQTGQEYAMLRGSVFIKEWRKSVQSVWPRLLMHAFL